MKQKWKALISMFLVLVLGLSSVGMAPNANATDSLNLSALEEVSWSDFGVDEVLQLRFDATASTVNGSKESIRLGFFNHSYVGRVDGDPHIDVTLPANGEKTEVVMDLDDFLVNGILPGFIFSVLDGPAWDSGDTATVKIENVQIVGGDVKNIDMSNATWAKGADGTGMEASNGWGNVSYADGATTISGMIFTDAHKVTFATPATTEKSMTLRFDATASTAMGSMEEIRLAFFNHSYVGRVDGEPHVDVILPTNGEKTEVVLNLNDFLVDGVLPGFMFSVLGGPAWDSGDTAAVKIENIRIVSDFTKTIDLSNATWAKGVDGTGMEASNGWGNVSYADGVTTISGMIFTDAHKVTFAKAITTEPELEDENSVANLKVRMDVTASTNDGTTEEIRVYFFNHTYTGDVCGEPRIEKNLPANGTVTKVEMELEHFLVDGAFPGFGFTVQNGPAWDSPTNDRTNLKFENIQIVGNFTKDVDLSTAVWAKGADTGISGCNGWGSSSYSDGATTISGMICFEGHEVTFAEPVTTEPAMELHMDVTASTAVGSMEEIRLAFFNHSYVGRVDGEPHVDVILPTNGEKTEVVLNLSDFLADGVLPGFMFSVLGGPAWDSGDTAAVKIENVRIVSDFTKTINLSNATWAKGVDGTGMEASNGWGNVSYADGATTISGMIFTDAHKVTFAKAITTEPELEDENSVANLKVRMDVTASTNDGTTEEIRVYFFNHTYTGDVCGEPRIEKNLPANGTVTKVEMELEHFLVDGAFPGFGFTVQNGPAWDSPTNDRTNLKFENIQIVGNFTKDVDLSTAVWAKGADTGISGCNGWGSSSYSDGATTISGMICFEGHEVTFAEAVTPKADETVYQMKNEKTLDNTIFNGDVVLQTGAIIYYGAGYEGLAIALTADGELKIGDNRYKASDFAMETFTDTRFNLKIAIGSNAEATIWINNRKAGSFASNATLNHTVMFDLSKVTAYAKSIDIMPGVSQLDDLYYDLSEGAYTVPSELISMKKKSIENDTISWADITDVKGGDSMTSVGDYALQYYEGYSEYAQEVILYNTNDMGLAELLRAKKHADNIVDKVYTKGQVRICDTNGDTVINDEDIFTIQNILIGF